MARKELEHAALATLRRYVIDEARRDFDERYGAAASRFPRLWR